MLLIVFDLYRLSLINIWQSTSIDCHLLIPKYVIDRIRPVSIITYQYQTINQYPLPFIDTEICYQSQVTCIDYHLSISDNQPVSIATYRYQNMLLIAFALYRLSLINIRQSLSIDIINIEICYWSQATCINYHLSILDRSQSVDTERSKNRSTIKIDLYRLPPTDFSFSDMINLSWELWCIMLLSILAAYWVDLLLCL